MTQSMTKADLASLEKSVEGMPGHMRSWILNRDVTKLVAEIRSKDALIAELIHYIDRIQWTDAEARNIAAPKARAGE